VKNSVANNLHLQPIFGEYIANIHGSKKVKSPKTEVLVFGKSTVVAFSLFSGAKS